MPFSSPPELLGNSPRGDLATWYFPPLFPAWHIHDLILCTTLRAARTHFRAQKSPAPLMACSVQAQGHLLTYTGYVYIYLCTATQMFNGLDVSKFRKTCQEKEKKKKRDSSTWILLLDIQMGQEVGNICISIATLKVNSSQSLFPLLSLCQRWQELQPEGSASWHACLSAPLPAGSFS